MKAIFTAIIVYCSALDTNALDTNALAPMKDSHFPRVDAVEQSLIDEAHGIIITANWLDLHFQRYNYKSDTTDQARLIATNMLKAPEWQDLSSLDSKRNEKAQAALNKYLREATFQIGLGLSIFIASDARKVNSKTHPEEAESLESVSIGMDSTRSVVSGSRRMDCLMDVKEDVRLLEQAKRNEKFGQFRERVLFNRLSPKEQQQKLKAQRQMESYKTQMAELAERTRAKKTVKMNSTTHPGEAELLAIQEQLQSIKYATANALRDSETAAEDARQKAEQALEEASHARNEAGEAQYRARRAQQEAEDLRMMEPPY